jgi:hypothetical protein
MYVIASLNEIQHIFFGLLTNYLLLSFFKGLVYYTGRFFIGATHESIISQELDNQIG